MSKTLYQDEVDNFICMKYGIELKELLSLDAPSLNQIRSDALFQMLGDNMLDDPVVPVTKTLIQSFARNAHGCGIWKMRVRQLIGLTLATNT